MLYQLLTYSIVLYFTYVKYVYTFPHCVVLYAFRRLWYMRVGTVITFSCNMIIADCFFFSHSVSSLSWSYPIGTYTDVYVCIVLVIWEWKRTKKKKTYYSNSVRITGSRIIVINGIRREDENSVNWISSNKETSPGVVYPWNGVKVCGSNLCAYTVKRLHNGIKTRKKKIVF